MQKNDDHATGAFLGAHHRGPSVRIRFMHVLYLEFCILSERKAYRLPDRPFGDRNARRNSGASRQVNHVLI